MKDIIDERNEKERIRKSIIKRWNVNYMPLTPEQMAMKQAEADRLAEEENAAQQTGEVFAENREADSIEDLYNATTGSYSGAYGRGEVNEVTKGQIDKILQEKSDALRDLIAHEGEV